MIYIKTVRLHKEDDFYIKALVENNKLAQTSADIISQT